jgi:type I restriction enzyme, S subunit
MAQIGATFEHYSLPAFDADQLPVFEVGEAIKSNKTRVPSGAVLQSKLNPHIPRVWLTGLVGQQAVCSTEFLPWIAKPGASPELLYAILRSSSFSAQVRTLVTGTSNSHQRVRPDQVGALQLVASPPSVISAFTSIAKPFLDKVVANRRHAKTLTDLRDALVPQLISGRLRLPECREEIQEAIA